MYQQRGYDYYSGHATSSQAEQGYPPQQYPEYTRGISNNPVVLDDYNSDLNFVIEGDGFTGSSLCKNGFEYLWAGARATYGVSNGKACFEVLIREKLPVSMPDSERNPHVARVGWSTDASNLNVGEDRFSYGYGGTGKSSLNNKFYDYGEPYTVNDVIGCYIDFDERCIFFAKNGLYLGKAFDLTRETDGFAFYPHVTIKNMKVEVNFGYYAPRIEPIKEFTMIEHLPKNVLIRGTRGPDTRLDSQVIMMVGLPGSGKTVWANKYTREHDEMKINILGTNTIMDKMKVSGLTRQRNYHGRWDQLIKQATNVLNEMFKIAEKKNRNYIIDQTNVFPSARRKKMSSFHGCRRVAAVIVNTNEVLKERTEKREREEGKNVPEEAVMNMKKNFTLPVTGESFDDVWFIEENQQTSIRLVEEFQKEGKEFAERQAEKEREEMKRKRDDQSTAGEPPSKEPYHSHTNPPHPPRDERPHEKTRHYTRATNDVSHNHARHHGHRGHHGPHAAPHYPPRRQEIHEPYPPRYPSWDYGNYNHPPGQYVQNSYPQYPPGAQGSHEPHGYRTLPPPQGNYTQQSYQNTTQFYQRPYSSDPSGYNNLPYPVQVQEQSPQECYTPYDSLTNTPRSRHEQHSGQYQSCDERYYSNTQGGQNCSSYYGGSSGY